MKQTFPNLHLIRRPGKLGYGTAFIDGFTYALDQDAELIISMDADFSHDPAEIPQFLDIISDADVVIGSRYINGIRILNWAFHRLLLSTFANRYVNLVLNMHLKDCTSGYRCYRAEVLKKIAYRQIKTRGYAFLVEILFRVKQAGCKIVEHPIVYTERREGQSKMSKSLIIESIFRPMLLRMETLLKRSP
jgi:dolichol-phosphate mannosyltransferase